MEMLMLPSAHKVIGIVCRHEKGLQRERRGGRVSSMHLLEGLALWLSGRASATEGQKKDEREEGGC